MSLTREESNTLTDLILQMRARSIELDVAQRKVQLANEALGKFIESLCGPTPTTNQCISCLAPVGVFGSYCNACRSTLSRSEWEKSEQKVLDAYKNSPIGVYLCLRCQGPVTTKGYCERCAANNAKVDSSK